MLAKCTLKIALIALAIVSTCVQANPNGPTVVNGSASFSQPNANTLNITTKTNKAIINWQGFNIGAGQTTNFHQPNRNSAVLNRVLSNSPSKIYGNLNSNGKVFLINQHGLMIGAGAKINTGGFFGSTLNITNEDFLNGNLKFEGGGFGGIINKGYIHAGPGGNVVLIAPDINNGGVIEVDDGKVILAAGKSIRITSLNDALIEFDVKSDDDNTIINLGDIVAKHGAARLFAGSLKHSGSINANSLVQNADGSISLVANTTADITGELIAGGDQGGRITVEAETINVSGHALINASGPVGGGTILIGGDRQGLNPDIRNATSTTVGPHARIHADATDSGDGGKVILFAERDVHVHGEVSARGGPHGGDGGFIETSGLQALDITRAPDASAASGAGGEWLIDPFNITIQDAGPESGITGGPSPTPLVSNAPAVLTTATIETALNNGTSVTVTTGGTAGDLQGNGDITVADPIDKTAGGVAALTLNAHNNITVNAPISASGVNALSITLLADSDSNTQGSINIAAPITTNNGDVILDATTSLDASSITIGSDINAGAGDIDLRTGTGINAVLQSGVISANALTSSTLTDLTVDRIAPTPVLDGLILDLNVDIINGSFLQAQNGLTLGGINNASPTITLASTGNSTEFNMNTTTIGGTGTILLADNFSNNNFFRPIIGTMTIGAGITVSGRGVVGGTFGGTSTVNQGVINANSATGALTLLEVTNNGTVNIANGSTLALDGSITTDDIGVLVNAGTGTTNLVGDLDNTGNTLALTASTGDLTISFGSITNGTVTTAGGSALLAGFNGTLDNVAINGDLTVGFGSTINLSNSVSVTNSLANSGDINVLTGSSLAVSGGGTYTGAFSIASGATLSLLGGSTHDFTAASSFSGTGDLVIGDSLVTLNSSTPITPNVFIAAATSSVTSVTDVTISGGLNLQAGSLGGAGNITVTGLTTWNPPSTGSTEAFTITGPGNLVANGGFDLGTNLDANDQLVLDKFLFINGPSSWDDAGSGNLSIVGGGIIFNNDFIQVNSIATGSAAQLDIGVPVTNLGEISKENGLGSLIFSAGLSVTGGNLNVSTGTIVEATGLILNGGELRGGGDFVGDVTSLGGIIDIEDPDGSPGTLSIIGDVNFLDQNSSIVFDIAGPADFDVLDIAGDLNLPGGYMVALWDAQYAGNGSHTLITTTGIINGGFTDEYLPAGTTGGGTTISVLLNSYSISLDTGGNVINFFTNVLGGDWNAAGNWSAGAPQAGQYAVIAQDDDTIEVTVAANSAVAGIEAQNTIRINNGSTLTVSGTNPSATLDYIFGEVILEGSGVLSIDGTALLTDVTTLDSGNLSGTGLYINHPVGALNIVGANSNNLTSPFDNNGVILNGFGPGTLIISGGGTLENFGKVQPGGPDSQGVLTFDGDFINRPTGSVEIEVAGPNGVPGDDHDQLVVTGDANLSGTLALLALGDFTVNNGDADIVAVTYGTFQNGFATIQPIDSESITPVYGANELTLQFGVPQLFTWIAANGDWNTGINWDLGTVPTVGDDAIIGFSGLNISIGANAGINTLSLAATNTLTLNSGTFTIAGDTSLDGGLNVAGGTLTGNGNLTVNEAFNWTGGSIAGSGQLTTTATSTLNSGGTLGIGRDWLNTGTINHTNGVLQIQDGAFITNFSSYNANGGTQISANGGAGLEGFSNSGQFNVNADILVQPELFDNDGTVTVSSGFVLSLGATGAGAAGFQTGTWDFADATISLLNNEWIIGPGFTILSQPGAVLNLSGGTLTNSLGGLLTLPANLAVNLNNTGSVIQGNDDIQIDGAFNWTAGTLLGNGLLTTTGTTTISSGGSLGTSKDWNNVGIIDHLAGQLQIQNGATIANSNIFNASGGSAITSNGGTGIELFNNAAGGLFTVTSNISIQPEQFIQDGLLEIVGGAAVSTNNADLTNTLNGVILATGTIDVGTGTLINDGTIHPGDVGNTGILTVLGNFTQSASGNLEIEIDDTGTQAGLDYDQLAVTSSTVPAVTLDGSLSVTLLNGDPLINDTFTLIDVSGGGSVAGLFANEFLPSGFDPLVYGPSFVNTVFAVLNFFFDNDFGDFSWNNPTNWSTDVLPTSVDDVSISGFDVAISDVAEANTLSLAADGTLTLNAGTLTIASDSTLDGLLTIADGNLDIGTATVTLAGGLAWIGTSDIIGNGGILNLPATNTFSGAGFRRLFGVTANISGPTTYSDGFLTKGNSAIINNSGVFDFAGDVSISDNESGGGFNNQDGGTLLKSAGAGTSFIQSIFNPNSNQGSVIVQTGTLDTDVATWTLGTGDSLSGSGTYIGDVVNAAGGVVSPGGASAIGILSILGNYTQSGGRLEIDVFDGGTQAGVNYDQLAISGTGTWTNTTAALDISYLNNGYVPSVGDAHTVVTCGDCGLGIDMGPITEPAGVAYLFSNNSTSYIATIDTVTFAWDGGGDGVDWFDPNNWLFNVTPDASIDAVISAGNTVNIVFDSDAGPAAANSLTLGGSLNIVNDGNLTIQDSVIDLLINPGGALTVNVGTGGLNNSGDAAINGSLALLNGNLNLAGNTVVNGNYTQSGGSAGFTGALTVNGSYNQSGGSALFNGGTSVPGSFSLSGAGVANFFTDVVASGSFTQTGGSAIFNVSTSALFSGSFAQSGGSSIFNGVVDFPGAVNLSGGLFSIDGFANLSNLNNNWSGGTISGAGSLVLGSVPGDSALAITGPAVKTLDSITLEMNQNDIDMSGNGNLLLTNNAVIINDGNTFNHSGDGSIAGVGTLDNSGGTFNKFAGTGTIAVDLINDASSTINVTGGTLVIDDPGVGDSATYNVDTTGVLGFAQNRQLDGALNLNGTLVAGPLTATTSSTTTLTLPASLVYNGSILLNDANLDLSSLSGNTLVMNATSQLGGRGTVQGNIDNAAGVLTAGGDNTLGNLEVSGAYSHGPSAAVKVNILNDGTETLASLLTINGVAQLDGGTLLIGYLDESITAVTADFIPIQFRGSVTGEFAQSIDADGSILLVAYAPNALIVVGSPIEIPEAPGSIVDDQVRFLDNLDTLTELISSNKSEAEAMIQELLDESEESGSLVCN